MNLVPGQFIIKTEEGETAGFALLIFSVNPLQKSVFPKVFL